MKKRILSLALALCCLVTAAPILALPATAAEAAAGQTDISYITGPLIWAEDFKNTAVGALPSG